MKVILRIYTEDFFDYNVITRLQYVIGDNEVTELINVIKKEEIEEMKKERMNLKEIIKQEKILTGII